MTATKFGLVARSEVRKAITDAYYETRNEGGTMEQAADRAADAVLAVLDPLAKAVTELMSAVNEITCTLDDPDGWTLGWQEAVELDNAARAARALLA